MTSCLWRKRSVDLAGGLDLMAAGLKELQLNGHRHPFAHPAAGKSGDGAGTRRAVLLRQTGYHLPCRSGVTSTPAAPTMVMAKKAAGHGQPDFWGGNQAWCVWGFCRVVSPEGGARPRGNDKKQTPGARDRPQGATAQLDIRYKWVMLKKWGFPHHPLPVFPDGSRKQPPLKAHRRPNRYASETSPLMLDTACHGPRLRPEGSCRAGRTCG